MEADRDEKKWQIVELKSEVKYLNEKVEKWIGVWIAMNNILEETVFLSTMWKKTTDEVVIEFLKKKWKKKWSANDIDRSHRLGKKNKPEVDLGLLSSNLPDTMSVM